MDWTYLKDLRFQDIPLDEEDRQHLQELAVRLQDNYPYHLPEYAGQMIKPPHPLAQAAYWMTTFVNPNNHALDGGRATSLLEMEVISALGNMIGYHQPLGHLTSGGTVANLEALWVARQLQHRTVVLANEHAHYTHSRMSEVLAMPYESVRSQMDGGMDLEDLKSKLEKHQHALIVATLGTTGMGAVDPLVEILELAQSYNARVHVDAAYGGYFKLCDHQPEIMNAFGAMHRAHSVVIDPHKHGLQPYGCGAVLFQDPEVGILYKHDSPYTYFTSSELHLGEITLECSRPGATAAALWTTLKKFPLVPNGRMSDRLSSSLRAARGLHRTLLSHGYFTIEPQLDIVVFSVPGTRATEMSSQNRALFEEKAAQGIHLALFALPAANCPWDITWDASHITVLRSVLMKPEHEQPELWENIAQRHF